MAQRQCEKCGESVDEARAFCPACGHAFVEEERRETKTEFESVDHTMQMGQTMYNQMLSDMGLNIGKPQAPIEPQNVDESRIETVIPAAAAVSPVEARTQTPAAPTTAKTGMPAYVKWILFGLAAFFLGLLLLFLLGVAFYWFMGRA